MVLNIAIIIVSIALIASVLLQSKGIGLGGLAGGDTGGVYTQRRGIEKSDVLHHHRPQCSFSAACTHQCAYLLIAFHSAAIIIDHGE